MNGSSQVSSDRSSVGGGRCVVVSGGDYSPFDAFLQPGDFIIACDRGYSHCARLSLTPDLLISDFDSYDGPVDCTVPVDRHRPEKDDTDTMLAIRYAIQNGFSKLMLCCALGGRLDHTLANLQALVYARKHGLDAVLRSEDSEVLVLMDGRVALPRREGWSLSVFAVDGPCEGVCLRGVKYPLDQAELLPSFPVGVSNEWASDSAEISVASGVLMIVQSKLS